MSEFSLGRKYLITQCIKSAFKKTLVDRKQRRECIICGVVHHALHASRDLTCSPKCGRIHIFLGNCPKYLETRRLRRSGASQQQIEVAIGINKTVITYVCLNERTPRSRWGDVLRAIEVVNEAKIKTWQSQHFQIEVLRAERLLQKRSLYDCLKREGILK